VILDLMNLRSLLMLNTYLSVFLAMILVLSWLIETIICFLEGPLVVILILGCGF